MHQWFTLGPIRVDLPLIKKETKEGTFEREAGGRMGGISMPQGSYAKRAELPARMQEKICVLVGECYSGGRYGCWVGLIKILTQRSCLFISEHKGFKNQDTGDVLVLVSKRKRGTLFHSISQNLTSFTYFHWTNPCVHTCL